MSDGQMVSVTMWETISSQVAKIYGKINRYYTNGIPLALSFMRKAVLELWGGREMTKERTVKVNLNNACSVILTQYGAEILNESNNEMVIELEVEE